MDFNASMIALATFLGAGVVGWAVLHGLRGGSLYISSDGNPRNTAQAFASIKNIFIGLGICAFFLLGGGAALWRIFHP